MAAKPIDPGTSLEPYRAKRDFTVTAEPAPGAAACKTPTAIFVVQEHAARRAGLHYDFRLEHGGVLWSWAVRDGPSLDPTDRRIAVHVEDHPIGYADFQGTIPEGEYGGGTAETWDRGTWAPLEDPAKGMHRGNLRFELSGKRLIRQVHAGPPPAGPEEAGGVVPHQGSRRLRARRHSCR